MQAGREIKFQVWDQDTKQMWTWDDILQGVDHGVICFVEMIQQDQFVKRQFTGLLDKNGKEIYEGDILRVDQWNMNGIVNFASGMFKVSDPMRTEFNPSLASFMVEVRCKVIGNIYENPELLQAI